MAPKPPHRKRRNNSKTSSQESPRTPPSESTTVGSSLPQTPWSSDYEEQDTTSRSGTRSSQLPSFDTPSSSNTTWPSSGSPNSSMAEIETFEMNSRGSSPSPLENANVSSSRVASQLLANGAESDDTSDDHGYVRETILLNHLKVIWSWIRFHGSYWKAITSVLLTISVVAIYIGIRYFDECNEWLIENDLPVMPSLEELNTMIGYTFFIYFSGVFVIFILGLAAWCSIDWKRMVSTETRRFVYFCLANLRDCWSWLLRGILSLFHTLVISPLTALFWQVISIPGAVISWFWSLVMWSIIKGDKICRRRFLVIIVVLAIFIHWLWERAYPLNAVEQLAAFAERYRGDDILAFCIFRTSYYVAYYYFACAHYFFPEKYEYNIWHDQVVIFITGLVVVIALSAIVIGKMFDWVMRNADDGKKMQDT
ncbi:uncharacterized protein FSUBG_13769 [Fusarium subglutinans]|uniref:Uncharacterized protein n=1 Tax=Gibberella subglutinans TaxID=42677 RepID=A0A8H5KTX1_GIBSU|nr:uncharacterized protein FSUBG_13769 [Fusarium subglutinans]KAF5578546.1 hypothetical protein FSUBG_13769 [Fusarium subglutinans]